MLFDIVVDFVYSTPPHASFSKSSKPASEAAGDVGDVMEDEAQLATELVPSKQDDEERSEKSLGPPPMDCLDGDARCPGVSEVLAVERPMRA